MKPNDIRTPSRVPYHSFNTSPNEISFPGRAMVGSGGAGADHTSSALRGVTFPNQATESSGWGAIGLPPNWAGKTISIDILWFATTTGAGTVRWSFYLYDTADGDSVAAAYTSTAVEDEAPASTTTANIASITLAAPAAVAESTFLGFRLQRRTDTANDDYEADVCVTAIKFWVR